MEVVYYRRGMNIDFVLRWRWYFEYLAARLKVLFPREKVELLCGRIDLLTPDAYISKKRESLLKAKKGQLKRLNNEPDELDLFDIAINKKRDKIERIENEIKKLENGEIIFWVPENYKNLMHKYLKKTVMNKSKIEWTERTWNPVTGCTKYSAGCANCYAETMAKRLRGMGSKRYKNGFNVTLHPEALNEPKKVKVPSMFFVCSMADLFHEDVPLAFIDKVMDTARETPWHTYQFLTKRPDRMMDYIIYSPHSASKNMWIGTTVEAEQYKDRIEYLRAIGIFNPECTTFLSCEPLLSDLGEIDLSGIDLVIVGGESGPNARPMKKEWVLNIQRQCEEQGVAFFFKQWGTWGEDGVKRNKKANGCLLDGVEYKQMPKGGAE